MLRVPEGHSTALHLNAANNRTFGYDEIHRLIAAAGPWGAGTECTGGVTYTYDDNGNRLCKGEQAPATNYSYVANTNLLDASTGGEVASYSYDDNGNTIGDGGHTYEYSDADRLATVDTGSTATYVYDGDGRRVIKTTGTSTYFFYDPSGRLLSEVQPDPKAGKDYIYVSGEPVARVDWTTEQNLGGNVLRVDKNSPNVRLDWSLFPAAANDYVVRRKQVVDPNDKTFDGSTTIATVSDPTQIYDDPVLNDGNDYDYRVFRLAVEETLYFYHTDQIGTPIAMSSAAQSVIWRAEYLPFGNIHALVVSSVPNEVRFPGQYADAETGFYQNVLRDYAPRVGRYVEPDPLHNPFAVKEGLYPYVAGNPLVFMDPLGLTCGPCCDTPAKIASDKRRVIRRANLRLSRYLATHMHVLQPYCQTFAGVIEEGIGEAKPQCHDWVDVFSKEQTIAVLIPFIGPESPAPAHVATALRPCDKDRWEDGFILDAWPGGFLTEFTWDNWRPRGRRYTPTIFDPAGAHRGVCRP